jgi:hypothetical protein
MKNQERTPVVPLMTMAEGKALERLKNNPLARLALGEDPVLVKPGQWPLGMIHRQPKAIDGDRKGNVQVLTTDGWELARWDEVVAGTPWQHTPSWKLNERADELLSQLVVLVGSRQPITFEMQELLQQIRGALRGEP